MNHDRLFGHLKNEPFLHKSLLSLAVYLSHYTVYSDNPKRVFSLD